MEPSKKYRLNKADMTTMLKVLVYSLASTVITVALAFSQEIEVPAEYAFLLPLINMLLVAAKRFVDGKGV